MKISTLSPDQTFQLGLQIANLLRVGDLVALSGALGAGKTALTQGIAHGLGVNARVTSPTFVLTKSYQGKTMTLLHIDAYRLGVMAEIDDLGVEAALASGVVVVEWGEGLSGAYVPSVQIEIQSGLGGNVDTQSVRSFEFTFPNDESGQRRASWQEALKESSK